MSAFEQYISDVIEPTFADFESDKTISRAFIAAVVIFHAIDRAKEDYGTRASGSIRKEWGYESAAFKLVDIVAHRFTYGWVLGRMTLHEFTYTMKDAISFLKQKAASVA